jgi:phosphoglycolate phosphatase
MPAYALAVFDFDGTLANSFPWFLTVLDRISDRFDLRRIPPEDVPALRDMSSRAVLAHLGVPLLKLPAIGAYMRQLSMDHTAHIPLFDGVGEALSALRNAGVRLAVVSSNAEVPVRTVLGPASDLIDQYACGSSLWGKAAKFRSVLKQARVVPSAAISIGDEIRDIESGREAGLATGAITFGYNSRKALETHSPDYLFDSYAEMVRAVIG